MKVGAYAIYDFSETTNGQTNTYKLKGTVYNQTVYSGQNCNLVELTTNSTQGNAVIYIWMATPTNKPVHFVLQLYMNNTLRYSRVLSFNDTQQYALVPSDITQSIGTETVTVPAGTFANCPKGEFTVSGRVTDVWEDSSIPIFGLVKSQTTNSNGVVIETLELDSYGGG